MAANLLAGEIGITAEGREYIFRPSFRKLAELGTPAQLVALFSASQTPNKTGFVSSLSILCHFIDCSTEDAMRLLGYHRDIKGDLKYVRGILSEPQDIPILAASLMKKAMIGRPSRRKGNAATEFDIMEFHGMAVAHLDMQPSEAWNMTMLEFQSAIRAKFGEPESEKVPTGEDIDALWAAVEEGRKCQKM